MLSDNDDLDAEPLLMPWASLHEILQKQESNGLANLEEVIVLESLVEETLLSLRRLHNSLAPIHTLPPELLFLILTYASTPDVSSTICRRWRKALASPPEVPQPEAKTDTPLELATPPSIPPSEHLPEIPVSIKITTLDDTTVAPCALDLLALQHDRLVTLDIEVPEGGSVAKHLDFTAPHLREFTCQSSKEDGLVLPQPLFKEWAPELKTVALTDLAEQSLSAFRNLTSLKLSTIHGRSLSQSSFFTLLGRCPLLQSLEITGYEFTGDYESETFLVLASLSTLTLQRTPSRTILSQIITPELTHLTIHNPTGDSDPTADPSSDPETQSHYALPQDVWMFPIVHRITSLTLTTHPSSGYSIHATSSSNSPTYTFTTSTGSPWTHISYIARTSLTAPLHTLTLTLHTPATKSDARLIRPFFLSAHCLRTLHVSKPDCAAPLLALLADDESLCPELESLCVGVSRAEYKVVFRVLKTIVVSRGASGRVVGVTCLGEDKVVAAWKRLCEDVKMRAVASPDKAKAGGESAKVKSGRSKPPSVLVSEPAPLPISVKNLCCSGCDDG